MQACMRQFERSPATGGTAPLPRNATVMEEKGYGLGQEKRTTHRTLNLEGETLK